MPSRNGQRRVVKKRDSHPTGYGLSGEVTKTAHCPGILIYRHETFTVFWIIQQIQEELGISLDTVYTSV